MWSAIKHSEAELKALHFTANPWCFRRPLRNEIIWMNIIDMFVQYKIPIKIYSQVGIYFFHCSQNQITRIHADLCY
ncbi:unnamed protein product [Acanthoscelides obtectus]|uniref:Uncharacterized protein n=1 Tax=Acanthoscelides obtectus TaxID=200917 RepID=A0A9P0K9M6_ACAOB|nr:unnamed protein product [Acanthoscelides obtectus]CAH1995744.1 unnamed protein product [Acanthoscelides obtectus]CAK1632265.1 hypothetical protein AOBTE_LOCUS7450 [Acanthoscelides obtectus]CAK1632293.1 hypothetical protein AOBTE_LOCUS7468 [Acanthoscelides obtectus]